MVKIKIKKTLPIIILAALTCLYFFNIITAKKFLWEDFSIYYFPAKSYVFNSLKSGQIPLWNPNLNLGYPIIADTTAAIFYPLNWLAIPFMTNQITTDYFIIELWTIFHLFLAGVFMYYLVDYLTCDNTMNEKEPSSKALGLGSFSFNPAALFAAIAFMFSGFFIGHLKHVAQITTACWFPLIFLFLYKSFKQKKYSFSIYAGILWCISILSGHLQIVYHFSFFLGLFILWEIISNFANKNNCKKPRPRGSLSAKDSRETLWHKLNLTKHCIFNKDVQPVPPPAEGVRGRVKTAILNLCNKLNNYKKIIISALITIIIAISLSAIHTLPFLEFLNNSTRNKVSTNFASSFSLKPIEFLNNLFLPHRYGGFKKDSPYIGYGGVFWETSIYMGILTLIFAIIALIKNYRKNNLIFFLTFSSAICLLLAFGKYSFFHPLLLNIIPGLNMIRAPSRFILPVIFSICLLSGIGFNYFLKKISEEEEKCNKKSLHHSSVAVSPQRTATEQQDNHFTYSKQIILIIILSLLIILSFLTTQNLNLPSSIITLNFVILIIILIYLYFKKYLNKKSFAYGLILILFIDIFAFGWQFNNGNVKPKEYYPSVSNKFSNGERIINDDYLMPNSAYIYNIPIMDSNHYMIIKDYYDFTNGLAENLYYWNKHRDFTNFFKNKTKLNLLGIKHIISQRDLSKWFPENNANIYINNEAYPRFLLSKKAITINDPQKILNLLDDPNYNPREIIYIENKFQPHGSLSAEDSRAFKSIEDYFVPALESPSGDSSGALQNPLDGSLSAKDSRATPPPRGSLSAEDSRAVEIVKYKNEYIKLEIENNNSNWLLANEIYYPGWQAKIDGKKIKIYKANHTFRAIPIPKGKHTVEFIFNPKSYYIGRLISLVAISILTIVGIFNFCYNKNKKI